MTLYNICPVTNKVEPKIINNSTPEEYKNLIYNDPFGFYVTRSEAEKALKITKKL